MRRGRNLIGPRPLAGVRTDGRCPGVAIRDEYEGATNEWAPTKIGSICRVSGQRQHGIHCTRREGDEDVGEPQPWVVSALSITATKIADITMAMAKEPSAALRWTEQSPRLHGAQNREPISVPIPTSANPPASRAGRPPSIRGRCHAARFDPDHRAEHPARGGIFANPQQQGPSPTEAPIQPGQSERRGNFDRKGRQRRGALFPLQRQQQRPNRGGR